MKRLGVPGSILVLAMLAVGACGGPEAPSEPVAERVENADLGLVIAALPAPFEVVSAVSESIELKAPGVNGDGTVVITAGEPSSFGINLVEAVKERKAAFEAAPGGRYFGNRTLGGSLGNVFTARGSYESDGGVVEETWALALHPLENNRLLTIAYTYPAGESQERVNQLLLLLGEIEPYVAVDLIAP